MRRASAQLVRIQPGARAVASSENVMRTCASVPAREFSVTFAWRQACARHSGDVPCVCIFNGRPTCIDAHAQCGSCIHSVLSLRKMRLPREMYALSLRARMWARVKLSARITSTWPHTAHMISQPFLCFRKFNQLRRFRSGGTRGQHIACVAASARIWSMR